MPKRIPPYSATGRQGVSAMGEVHVGAAAGGVEAEAVYQGAVGEVGGGVAGQG